MTSNISVVLRNGALYRLSDIHFQKSFLVKPIQVLHLPKCNLFFLVAHLPEVCSVLQSTKLPQSTASVVVLDVGGNSPFEETTANMHENDIPILSQLSKKRWRKNQGSISRNAKNEEAFLQAMM